MANNDEYQPLLLSIHETAKLLGVGRTKVYELLATRAINTVRIGRRTLVARADVIEYVEAQRREARVCPTRES